MNQPIHKRPRKAVMRVDALGASITGASVVLLDRAQSYLSGDEVFEELYRHAVHLEAMVGVDEDEARANSYAEADKAINTAIEALKREHGEWEKALGHLHEVAGQIAEVVEAAKSERDAPAGAADIAGRLVETLSKLRSAITDIPNTAEQIDELEGVMS